MLSQGSEGGEGGIEEQGHASPSVTPSTWVRDDDDQTSDRPFMRTVHRVGIVTMGTEEAWVEGWERR